MKLTTWNGARVITGRGGRWPRTALFAAAVFALLSLTPAVSAESLPESPRPPESCSASLTLTPSVTAFASEEPVELRVGGLEPHAQYRVFVGNRPIAEGFVAGDGTATTALFLNTLVAANVPVQVATSGRCAQAALTVVGPLRIRCEPIVVNGVLFCSLPVP